MKKLLTAAFLLLGLLPAKAQDVKLGYNNCGGVLVASCVLKTASGLFYSVTVTSTTASTVLYVYLFDSATLPSNGTVAPMSVFSVTSPGTLTISYVPGAVGFSNGLTIACGTTGSTPVNLTIATAVCYITGHTQ